MEHLLQFAINIDDEYIRESVYQSAEKQLVAECTKEFKRVIFNYDRWGTEYGASEWAKRIFLAFLEQNKDVIVDRAVENLADRLARSKTVREAAASAVQNMNREE